MAVDYSQALNKCTFLDAYLLPNIESFVANIAKYKVFRAIDLKSAYHQKTSSLPIRLYNKIDGVNVVIYQFIVELHL